MTDFIQLQILTYRIHSFKFMWLLNRVGNLKRKEKEHNRKIVNGILKESMKEEKMQDKLPLGDVVCLASFVEVA